jgi:hypothetical protein
VTKDERGPGRWIAHDQFRLEQQLIQVGHDHLAEYG